MGKEEEEKGSGMEEGRKKRLEGWNKEEGKSCACFCYFIPIL